MEQTLYGDVLFLVNFTMDYLTLFITSKALNRAASVKRLSLAAAAGAVYGVAACLVSLPVIIEILINLAVSYIICRISFGKRDLFPCFALFYGSGCLLGGVLTALFGFFDSIDGGNTVLVNGSYHTVPSDIPLGWMAVIAVITALIASACGQMRRRKAALHQAEITVVSGERSISIKATADTGNLLTDPFGMAVIIMTRDAFFKIIPDEIRGIFESCSVGGDENIPPKYIKRIRAIPAVSIGGSSLLLGYIPDRLLVMGKEKEAIIALSPDIESFGGNPALIPTVLL